nr:DUF433 domain-containing protein [Bacteroidota bacterium]
MDFKNIIIRDPEVMLGKPIISGTRITVELIIRKLSSGYSFDDLLNSYPVLSRIQINAALFYAAEIIANEQIIEA